MVDLGSIVLNSRMADRKELNDRGSCPFIIYYDVIQKKTVSGFFLQ